MSDTIPVPDEAPATRLPKPHATCVREISADAARLVELYRAEGQTLLIAFFVHDNKTGEMQMFVQNEKSQHLSLWTTFLAYFDVAIKKKFFG